VAKVKQRKKLDGKNLVSSMGQEGFMRKRPIILLGGLVPHYKAHTNLLLHARNKFECGTSNKQVFEQQICYFYYEGLLKLL